MKCMMCRKDIEDNSEVGMCKECMYGVWGEKMAEHIVNNFKEARKNGTLLNQK